MEATSDYWKPYLRHEALFEREEKGPWRAAAPRLHHRSEPPTVRKLTSSLTEEDPRVVQATRVVRASPGPKSSVPLRAETPKGDPVLRQVCS
jgi:hypothetical protein